MGYLLSRKRIDELTVEWEKLYDKGTSHDSLPMYIAKKQTEYILKELIEKGYYPEKAQEELAKISIPCHVD